jgi:tetratricopeptide (TPR) repeat protein
MRQMKRGHYEEDQFQSTLHKAMKFIIRHKDTAIVIAAVIIIGGGYLIYSSSRTEKQNPEADILHTQAMGLISMGRFEEAEKILLDLTTRFPRSRAGKIGVYYLGVINYHTGKFDESLKYFQEFLHIAGNDYLLAPSAHFGAACAAEGIKDYGEAQTHYKKIISNKKSPFYFPAALSYARVTGLLGDKDEATRLLQELLDKDPPADIAMDAQFYIGFFSE